MTATTRDQAFDRMHEIYERLKSIAEKPQMTRADDREFEQLRGEFEQLRKIVDRSDHLAEITAAARGGSARGLRLEHGSIQPFTASSGGSVQRDAAMRQLERSVTAGFPAGGAEVLERLADSGPEFERSWTQRWITDSGSPEYLTAFAKLVMHGESRAGLEWTGPEREAWDRVARLKAEQRALSLTDSAGGYLVPFELDPSVIITSAGSTNPLLQISRVVTSVSDVWHGVSAASVQASWDAEASEVSDDSPPFAEPAIPNYKGAAFCPFSIELQLDAPTLLAELGRLLSDGMLQLLNDALTTGSGVGMPTGIVTALQGGSSVVPAATADTITAADVYATQSGLGPRWQPNARWCANLAILNKLRQLESANGSLLFPELRRSANPRGQARARAVQHGRHVERRGRQRSSIAVWRLR